jgi:polysaccharide biosynthesis protein VpsQ
MIQLIKWLKPHAGLLFIILIIAVITVSSIPSVPILKIKTAHSSIRLDYLIHFCEYGALTFLALLWRVEDNFRIIIRKFLVITALLMLFAIADEFHQKFIPGRAFNVKDIASNLFGVIGGFVFCISVFRIIVRKTQ